MSNYDDYDDYEDDDFDIYALIDEVYSFLPIDLQDSLSEQEIEVALEKNKCDVKRTVESLKRKYKQQTQKKVQIIEKSTSSPRPQSKNSNIQQPKNSTSKTPQIVSKNSSTATSPLPRVTPSISPRHHPTTQHSAKKHEEILNKINEQKSQQPLTLIFCGHVDSGKSTTVGHVLTQIGHVLKPEIERNKQKCKENNKPSFEYAFVMDTDDDEREKGITISVGSVEFEYKEKLIRILDAPGHTDFLMKTIDAMNEADIAVVVLEVDHINIENKYEGTFIDIITTLANTSISKIVIAINKMDKIEWNETMYNSVVKKCEDKLRENDLHELNIRYIPISGLEGENLIIPTKKCKWIRESLFDIIVQEDGKLRNYNDSFRMICNESYKQGNNTIVSGTVVSGFVTEKDNVLLFPYFDYLTVKKVRKNQNCYLEYAKAGDSVELQLDSIDHQIMKSCVLTSPAEDPIIHRKFDATVFLDCKDLIIRRGVIMTFYSASGYSPCVFARIRFAGTSDVVVRPSCLKGKVQATVEIILQTPLYLDLESNSKIFGSFFLRCNSVTIGKGIITEFKDN